MPRGVSLTVEEQATILAYHKAEWTIGDIARTTERSPGAVRTVVRRGRVQSRSKRRGPHPKISSAAKRMILRRARTGLYLARDLRDAYCKHGTVRRVQQILSNNPPLQWTRIRKAPALTREHKDARLAWSRAHVHRGPSGWKNTIFSDEKRWSLDGPDGLGSYWRDMRSGDEKRWVGKRQQGGGSVMVWGAFSSRGKSPLIFVTNTINATRYIEVLEDGLLPFMDETHPNGAVFQQDNASSHISNDTKEWLFNHAISVMDWPACSPDMNPIENLWGIMSQEVYKNNRQFYYEDDLKEAILHAWDKIPLSTLKNLSASMPKRVLKLFEKKGCETGC